MRRVVFGPMTGADLSATAPFRQPWEADPWGGLREGACDWYPRSVPS